MHTLWQDVRYALRMLTKNSAFSVVAILTLALGIGANTALFSVISSMLLNPLPYEQSDQLVAIYAHTPEFSHSSIAYPDYLDWRRENHAFSQMAAFRQDDVNVSRNANRSNEGVAIRVKTIFAITFRRRIDGGHK